MRKWIIIWLLIPLPVLRGQVYEIERFELLNTENGLSHNSVMSMYCDSRGFIWIGTMDGLNRFNGYNIDVFKSNKEDLFSLNNNRITSIWEDMHGFIWLKTHDGYMHYFDPSTERFYTYPRYRESDEEKTSSIQCFSQLGRDEIWLGSSSSGAYRLCYVEDSVYCVEQFRSRGTNPITNNSVTFICEDQLHNVWVGTDQGLNRFKRDPEGRVENVPEHFLVEHAFTAAANTSSYLWLGTKDQGIIRYQPITRKFSPLILEPGNSNLEITALHLTDDESYMVAGTRGYGVYFFNRSNGKINRYELSGEMVKDIFEDSYGDVWITTDAFGVTLIRPDQQTSCSFMLTTPETQHLIDAERTFFFEDSNHILWVGTHGGGVARFNRESNQFEFYRNDPQDPSSISSNFVYSIIEDQSGLLWVGTGQFNGGMNKAIPVSSTFRHIQPVKQFNDFAENVIRSILEDSQHHIWLANKAGEIIILSRELDLLKIIKDLPLEEEVKPGVNVYSMIQDRAGYLWLGSKGGGVAVSTRPLSQFSGDFSDLSFNLYTQENTGPEGLSSNMVYSILEDKNGTIWIGTYGGGINRVEQRSAHKLACSHFTESNSNLKSSFVRHIFQDSRGRLWFATTFGIHLLDQPVTGDSAIFRSFIYDPDDPSSISYNDIIHIFEDSDNNLWFGTFGGGLNKLTHLDPESATFSVLDDESGLINDAVFGILQDTLGYIWASTENGVSRIAPLTLRTDNYNNNNGLQNSNFSENTCLLTTGGEMIFGNTEGILIISPGEIKRENFVPPVVFTNLYISNTLVDFKEPVSPIGHHINFLDKIILRHDQSSFSLEFAALSYFDPRKNRYEYRLDNYDDDWTSPGPEHRATFTKVPPGSYTFQVKGSNWDDTWNEIPRSLSIVIRPPWWKTTVAKILYVIILIFVFEISRRLFMNYYRLRNDLMVEKRINEIKLQFFTNISHEIRTPLTLILGPVEDIRRHRNLPTTVLEPLEIIQRNSKRILRLVNQLLDFRKIQNRKMRLNVQQVNLEQFILDVCHNFDYLALQKKIRFRYPVELPGSMVWFDPDKMDTVLFNILSNAFKFTPADRGIEVGVSYIAGGSQFEITVSDEGVGIPEEKLSLMFQRYTTLATEKMTLTGTGIGLAFSNEIVKAHGGRLQVDSRMGEGSKFVIQVPARKESYPPECIREGSIVSHTVEHEPGELVPLQEEGPEYKDVAEGITDGQKPILLLVEDHYDIRQYIRNLLSSEFEIEEAVDGMDGLKKISRTVPDLIITDLMMSGMDGLEMTKKIKNDFNTSHIPVIMLTARSSMDNQIEGIESGAEAYILKPFNPFYLKTVIRNLLRQRKLLNQKLIFEQKFNPDEIRITSRDEEFIREMILIIETHYHEPGFGVEKMAEYSGVGKTLLYHKIKTLSGMPPVQFIRQMRIKIAARLLVSNGYNVSEIAYMTGFSDIKYFRKCFKSVFGVTPSKYREKQKT